LHAGIYAKQGFNFLPLTNPKFTGYHVTASGLISGEVRDFA